MSKINIKNITLDISDPEHQKIYDEAVQHAFKSIPLDVDSVNLIKVKVADIPAEKMQCILRDLSQKIYEVVGVKNCVLVPLHPRGIQDITIEKIEVVHED